MSGIILLRYLELNLFEKEKKYLFKFSYCANIELIFKIKY